MLLLPYDVDVPYSTCVLLASLVVHDMEAVLDVTPEADTPVITGVVVSGVGVGVGDGLATFNVTVTVLLGSPLAENTIGQV